MCGVLSAVIAGTCKIFPLDLSVLIAFVGFICIFFWKMIETCPAMFFSRSFFHLFSYPPSLWCGSLPAPTKSIGPMIVPPPGAPIQSDTPGSDGERPPFFMWIRSVSFRALREDVERLLESVTVRRMGFVVALSF